MSSRGRASEGSTQADVSGGTAAGSTNHQPGPHDRESGRASAPRFRLVLLVVLVLALVASAGVLVWLLAGRRGEADDQQRQREAVMDISRRFMLATNSYGPQDVDDDGTMPDYSKSVSALITPKFKTSFDKSVQLAQQVAASGVTREATVFGTGVDSLDGDSAVALVAGSVDTSYTPKGKKKPVQQETLFRVEVRLVESDGDWLVDDFTPVTGAGQTEGGAQ